MVPNISVCMAVKNGETFLHEQIASVLPQLTGDDELVISDDHSIDGSLQIIEGFQDRRIRILNNSGSGLISNFENALKAARGNYVFLADQDDVWSPDKIAVTIPFLHRYDLVVSDCVVVDRQMEPLRDSFYDFNSSGKGILRNLVKNSYMGCCMAFHRRVAERALPFPRRIPMHDAWIGLIGEVYFSVRFINAKLVFHRRHDQNASTNSGPTSFTLGKRVSSRFHMVKEIIELTYAA